MTKTPFWIALTAYLLAVLLPQGALVQCVSGAGHATIELAHITCSNTYHADFSEHGDAIFSLSTSDCTDSRILLAIICQRNPWPSCLNFMQADSLDIRVGMTPMQGPSSQGTLSHPPPIPSAAHHLQTTILLL